MKGHKTLLNVRACIRCAAPDPATNIVGSRHLARASPNAGRTRALAVQVMGTSDMHVRGIHGIGLPYVTH